MGPPPCRAGIDLTFDQVKEARLFAWNDNRYLYSDGRLLRMRPHADGTVEVTDSDERATNIFTQRGWHHLAGCRCQFCSSIPERRLQIVAVDDDDAGRYVLTRTLQAAGFNVVEATGGRQALEVVTPATDLVLLDINMPDIDGFEVCRQLKADPSRMHVPVIFVTATAVGAESEREGRASGCDHFVTQPVTSEQLLRLVAEFGARGEETRPSRVTS